MPSCETYLWEIVREVEPTAAQKEGAGRSHNNLRDLLDSGNFSDRIVTSFLSGSYSRDTAIRPIDDVDVIFIVKPECWTGYPGFTPPPSKILDSFAEAIRYRYPVSSVFGQRRSVRLQLHHLDIDVVPAIYASSEKKFLKIPDATSDSWILTAPQIHAGKATEVNSKQNGKFKPLVKLLKFWNKNLPSTVCFKSFAIETIAVRVFSTIEFQSLESGLLQFFDFVAYLSGKSTSQVRWNNSCGISFNFIQAVVPDVADTGSNTTAEVDSTRRSKFVEQAVRSRDLLLAAIESSYSTVALQKLKDALRY